MFTGINPISMDVKGRIAMPSKYRDGLLNASNGRLMVTINLQFKNLFFYSLPVWSELVSALQKLDNTPDVVRYRRLILAYATEVEMDKSGRVLVPQALRSHAELDKQVVLVGQGEKLELWSDTNWDDERDLGLEQVMGKPLPEALYSVPHL